MVQRVLHTSERLRGVIVLVVDVQIVMRHCLATLLRQQVVVNKGLGGLRCELHHHASWCVGIHVGIFASDIVVLHIDDIQEHITGLGLTGYAALVTVGDVFLGNILAARLHQLHLHQVLNLLYGHLALSTLCYAVCDLI